jgi:pyridinium-3,5-biscarboxylic acid mononucleotide sulfurtransferase
MENESVLLEKYKNLQTYLRNLGSIVIGFSGGVDSTLLLKVAVDVLGEKALAVIGKSEIYPTREFEEARQLAGQFGARTIIIETQETDQLKFKENPPDRCYFCKTELFSKLHDIAKQEGIPWIADGSIMDDTEDFRPGMKALRELNVVSPLLESGLTKQDVRDLSKHLGLPTWNKQSFACLSSRFPYGTSISRENLVKIDAAETVMHDLGFRSYRVRFHDEKTARIEIGQADFSRILDQDCRNTIIKEFKKIGFLYITLDLQGYRTGSMNETLSSAEKERYLSRNLSTILLHSSEQDSPF